MQEGGVQTIGSVKQVFLTRLFPSVENDLLPSKPFAADNL